MDSPLRGTHRVRASKGSYSQTGQGATLTYNSSSGIDSQAGDEAALEALYTSTNGGSWDTTTGWASSGISLSDSIHGVTTDTIGEELRVTEIDLKNNNLSGPLPEDLENLKQCTVFDVRQGNLLTGDIPEGLWGMTALTHLKLEGRDDNEPDYTSGGYHPGKEDTSTNDFSGSLSSGLGNLTNLKEFWLERQGSMSGAIPSTIGNLTSLQFFSIYGKERDYETGFTGEIPTEIGNCTDLEFLLIGRNAIEGTLPTELGSCTKLRNFWFGATKIEGNLPASFANMTQMKYFFHDRNGVSGTLPDFVFDGTWPELNTFAHGFPAVAEGQAGDRAGYDVDVGTIDWSNVPNLQHFSIPRNAHYGTLNSTITQIDPEIFNFGFPDDVGTNTMSGTLPQSGYENWTNVRYWRILGHDMEGAIPTGYTSIERLHFDDNNFSSFDSAAMIGVSQLEEVDVTQNRLTPKDIVPGIGSLPGYNYSDQKPFGDGGSATVGDTLDLSAFDFTDNSYQWQSSETEEGTYSNLSGETSNTLDTTSHGAGFYKMLIDHPDIAQTFESKPIEVT